MIPQVGRKIAGVSITGLTAGANNTGRNVAHGLGYTPTFVLVVPTTTDPFLWSVTALNDTNVTLSIRTQSGQTSVTFDLYVG
jgi:hypothetical protein